MNKDAIVIKKLTELGFDLSPKTPTPKLQQLVDRLNSYEKEMGQILDPHELEKYIG